MTPAATPEALEQALARELARLDGWQDPEALWTDNLGVIARGGEGSPVYLDYIEDASKLIAGPLAPVLADLQRVTAERDAARKEASDLQNDWADEVAASRRETERADTAEAALATATAEAASLRAEVEALVHAIDMAKAEITFAQQDEADGSSHASRRVRFRGIIDALNGAGNPAARTALARAATAGEG